MLARIFLSSAKSPTRLFTELPKRSVSVRWWPTLENPWADDPSIKPPTQPQPRSIDYEISYEDFKWVEKLLKDNIIPSAPENVEFPTPSGWVPPNLELAKQQPYFVRRSKNHMLPVYYQKKYRKESERSHGYRHLTVIRNIDGDMWALANDLRQLLEPKCDGNLFMCQVDEATRRIRLEGIFLDDVAKFLLSKGF